MNLCSIRYSQFLTVAENAYHDT